MADARSAVDRKSALPEAASADEVATPVSFADRHRKFLLGCLAVVLFFAAWQAAFLVVPFNPLFISKPSLIADGLLDLIESGQLLEDLRVSAVPFVYGLAAATVVGVAIGVVMGWRARLGYALDPLMTMLYASPLVALAPLIVVFFGVGVAAKAIIIFSLSLFPFVFNAYAGARAVDPLLINVVRSLGGTEKQLYLKVILPSILPYIVAGARLAIVYTGAIAPEAIEAHRQILEEVPGAGLLAVTSADRLNAGWHASERARQAGHRKSVAHVEKLLAPLAPDAGLVTLIDGHPATLSWLGGVRGHGCEHEEAGPSGGRDRQNPTCEMERFHERPLPSGERARWAPRARRSAASRTPPRSLLQRRSHGVNSFFRIFPAPHAGRKT